MANWKKIIVSGSGAHLASVTASNLTANTILIGGTNGLIQNSGITFESSTYSFGATNLVATGASSALTGSFTGSFAGAFTGDGSALTGVALNIDALGDTGVTTTSIAAGDLFVFSDNGTEKKVTYTQLFANILQEVTGDITISEDGVAAIGAGQIDVGMLSSSLVDETTTTLDSGVITVVGTPQALTAGSGLSSTGTFNGSTARTFNVDSGSMMPFISSSVFSVISGDITIAANGTATIPADTIDGSQLANDITIANDLTVTGDLIVNGDTTTVSTTNLLVEDKFILLNSGSANAPAEGGIIVDEGSGTGVAYLYETDNGVDRWGFNASVAQNVTTADSNAYAAAIIDENNSNHTGAVSASYEKNGNIRIAANGDIFIYS